MSLLLAILAFCSAHSTELLGAAYALLNLANALTKGSEAKSLLSKLADFLSLLTRRDAPGTLKLPGRMSHKNGVARPPINLVPVFVAFAIAATSCAHVPPSFKAYGDAFLSCLQARGLQAMPGLAGEIFDLLDRGLGSAGDLSVQLEELVKSQGLAAAKDIGACAVEAWLGAHPIGDGSAPSNSQAAARVFLAKRALGR